ncbi:MAG: hypothetical protein V1492_02310 [Candidatus Micrarchaeota archaeon]
MPIKTVEQILSAGAAGVADPSIGYWGLVGLSGAALVTSSVIIAAMYIWSSLLRNQQMTASVKMEIYELISSAILFVMVLGLVGALQNISVDWIVPSALLPHDVNLAAGSNIYSVTSQYFLAVKGEMLGWIEMAYVLNIPADLLGTITPYTKPLSIGVVSSPLAGLGSPIKQLLTNAIVGLVIAYVVNYAQYFTYLFAIDVFLKYYLPAGIFLRCFTPTRKIGGSMIAIAVTFLVIMPAISLLAFMIFYGSGQLSGWTGFLDTLKTQGSTFTKDLQSWIFTPSGDFSFWDVILLPLYMIVNAIKGVFGTFFFLVIGFAGTVIGRALLIGYIMPTFNIMMLVQAARSLSKSFGEEIDVSSLTRLI